MEVQVSQAIQAIVKGCWNGSNANQQASYRPDDLYAKIVECFDGEPDFVMKLNRFDELMDNYPYAEAIREILVDMLFIHFFSTDAQRLEEDYLDSPEWEQIEDETIERGTELLNLFLYLKECNEEEEEPELGHFLKEFLLIDEDEFQDEYEIYEQVIANQLLVEAETSEIARIYDNIAEDDEIKPVFYPLMSFFANPIFEENEFNEYLKHSKNKPYDAAALAGIYGYYHGTAIFPKNF
jgi:hypothetical protein